MSTPRTFKIPVGKGVGDKGYQRKGRASTSPIRRRFQGEQVKAES